ncbi:MAG: SMI1/KNR4 family protein [Armatimonadetes bacterium]|nr:SMI1/KNR4 family protein [Armatimonadota bacterium]
MAKAEELFWDTGVYDELACPPLPAALVEVLRVQNGGALYPHHFYVGKDRDRFPFTDEEGCTDIMSLYGICPQCGINQIIAGETLNRQWQRDWGYPEDSVVLSHLGHGGIALHYASDPPVVINVFAEYYPTTLVDTIAPTFEAFLAGLVRDEEFVRLVS